MNKNKIKIIIYIFTSFTILGFVISDYIEFDLKSSYSSLVYGNVIVSNEVILDHLKDKKLNNIYSTLIEELKIVNISNNKKLIIVKENLPRFYDDRKIYLKSGLEVVYKNYPNYNLLIQDSKIPKFYSYNELDISSYILKVINLLDESNSPLFSELDLITLSEDNVLSMKIKNCEIVLMDDINSQNKKQIINKIKVLNEFFSQSDENIKNISHIDLRYNDKIFIKSI